MPRAIAACGIPDHTNTAPSENDRQSDPVPCKAWPENAEFGIMLHGFINTADKFPHNADYY